MALRARDLPPGPLRDQLAQLTGGAKSTGNGKPAKRSSTVGDGAPCPGRCSCGDEFTSYLKWEKHRDAVKGRHRWEMAL